jgi:hypothetical protein
METLTAAFIIGAALSDPGGTFAWHSQCNRYMAPQTSAYAGDVIEFSADGKIIFNGEVSKPVFEEERDGAFFYHDAKTYEPIMAVGFRDQYSASIEVFGKYGVDQAYDPDSALWEAACDI